MNTSVDRKLGTDMSGSNQSRLAMIACSIAFFIVPAAHAEVDSFGTQKPQPATASPCCEILTVNLRTAVVNAKVKATGLCAAQ
jgi:hypothetical protein